MKFIFVSGGVISGPGKGITVSSIGRLLISRGLNVSADPLTAVFLQEIQLAQAHDLGVLLIGNKTDALFA